jgi:hypothetical protein
VPAQTGRGLPERGDADSADHGRDRVTHRDLRINRERQRAERGELDARRKTYASDMNRVQRGLELNNLGGALKLVDRYRPTNRSETDLRGWEWRYLWNQCRSDAQSVFCESASFVTALSVSHDGAWVAVGMRDAGVSLRDRATGQEITNLVAGGHMIRAAFSPREPLLAYTTGPGFGAVSKSEARLLAVHEALDQLAAEDAQKAEVVKLRFFVGMSDREAAEALGIRTNG